MGTSFRPRRGLTWRGMARARGLRGERWESRQVFEHSIQHLGGVAFPVLHLAEYLHRMGGTVGLGDIARELLVRNVGVVFKRTRGLDDVDVAPLAAAGQCSGQFLVVHSGPSSRQTRALKALRQSGWFLPDSCQCCKSKTR